MPCQWCHAYCGDRGFCNEDCYDQYQEAQAEYQAQSECAALLGEFDNEPPESTMGNKGNI